MVYLASLSSKRFPLFLLMMPGHANSSSLDWFSIVREIQESIGQLGLSEMTGYKLKWSYSFCCSSELQLPSLREAKEVSGRVY